jgi:hypothetical protein
MGANTVTITGNTIEIVPHATWDADWSVVNSLGWADGLRLHSIVFKGGTANDVLIVLNSKTGTTTTDPEIVNWKIGGDTEEQVFYGNGARFYPFIDASSCVGDADCRILIHFL